MKNKIFSKINSMKFFKTNNLMNKSISLINCLTVNHLTDLLNESMNK